MSAFAANLAFGGVTKVLDSCSSISPVGSVPTLRQCVTSENPIQHVVMNIDSLH